MMEEGRRKREEGRGLMEEAISSAKVKKVGNNLDGN